MIHYDSYEVEKFRLYIANRKQYKEKLAGNTKAYQFLQKEILFLENDILPIVLKNTNLAHSEFVKYAINIFDTAWQFNCNGLLFYQSLKEDYAERPIIGIANDKYFQEFGKIGSMNICIDNMDGNEAKPQPLILPINGLL